MGGGVCNCLRLKGFGVYAKIWRDFLRRGGHAVVHAGGREAIEEREVILGGGGFTICLARPPIALPSPFLRFGHPAPHVRQPVRGKGEPASKERRGSESPNPKKAL